MKEDLVYNASYNHKGVTKIVGGISKCVQSQADRLSSLFQALTDDSPYATDHAAENLENIALQLTTLAKRASNLARYTNYPSVKPVSYDRQLEDITNV